MSQITLDPPVVEEETKAWVHENGFWRVTTDPQAIAMEEVIWATNARDLISQLDLTDLPDSFHWQYNEEATSICPTLKYTGTNVHELIAFAKANPDKRIRHDLTKELAQIMGTQYSNPICGSDLINRDKAKNTIKKRKATRIKKGELHHEHRVFIAITLQSAIQKRMNKYSGILYIEVKWTSGDWNSQDKFEREGSYLQITGNHIGRQWQGNRWSVPRPTKTRALRKRNYFNLIPELYQAARELIPTPTWRKRKGWRQLMRELKPAIQKMKADPMKRPLGIVLERECREMGL